MVHVDVFADNVIFWWEARFTQSLEMENIDHGDTSIPTHTHTHITQTVTNTVLPIDYHSFTLIRQIYTVTCYSVTNIL